MDEKIERYPRYLPVISVPMPEFLDVLNAVNEVEDALDIDFQVDIQAIRDIFGLVNELEDQTKREYYKKVVMRWLADITAKTTTEQG